VPLAGLPGAAAAALLAPALFRLREAYFSIGLWVFAEIAYLVLSKTTALGSTAGPLRVILVRGSFADYALP
jgi:branched-chain amino acid transport system permease protein